jgi:hypothetical protein
MERIIPYFGKQYLSSEKAKLNKFSNFEYRSVVAISLTKTMDRKS